MPRSLAPEILDGDDVDVADLSRSLGLVAQVNRRLGGLRALRGYLAPWRTPSTPLSVLDVGTGNGETAAALRGWGSTAGARWTVVGLDRSQRTARLAVSCGVPSVAGDALRLPFRDRAFDVVVATLTLHHFAEAAAVAVVAEMARIACLRVIVNDLERHALNYLAARVLARTVWRRCPVTRHDGPLSVLRAFTPDELRRIGAAAGLRRPKVRRHFPFRLVLSGEVTGTARP